MLTGDVDTGKATLRDYINATVGFEKLGEATGTQPKSLIRMFGPRGNPQAHNLFGIMGSRGDGMNKPPARALRAFDKWGEAATPGFQLVPDVLLKNQAKLS
jgi:hypothetical protein